MLTLCVLLLFFGNTQNLFTFCKYSVFFFLLNVFNLFCLHKRGVLKGKEIVETRTCIYNKDIFIWRVHTLYKNIESQESPLNLFWIICKPQNILNLFLISFSSKWVKVDSKMDIGMFESLDISYFLSICVMFLYRLFL